MDRRNFVKTGSAVAIGGLVSGAFTGKAPGAASQTGHKFVILSCDGGGMRGYLSSLLLKKPFNTQDSQTSPGQMNRGRHSG